MDGLQHISSGILNWLKACGTHNPQSDPVLNSYIPVYIFTESLNNTRQLFKLDLSLIKFIIKLFIYLFKLFKLVKMSIFQSKRTYFYRL